MPQEDDEQENADGEAQEDLVIINDMREIHDDGQEGFGEDEVVEDDNQGEQEFGHVEQQVYE